MSQADDEAKYINFLLDTGGASLDDAARKVFDQLRGVLDAKKIAQSDYAKHRAQAEEAARRFNDNAARADALANALIALRPSDPTPIEAPQPKPRKSRR